MFGSGGRREGFPKVIPESPRGASGLSEAKRFQSTPNIGSLAKVTPTPRRPVQTLQIGKSAKAVHADADTSGSDSEVE